MVDRRSSTGGAAPPQPVSTVDPAAPIADPAAVHYDDEERPARELTGRIALGVSTVAVAVALLVLWQVFRPLAQGSQYYLIIFLAGTLPLVFLAYHSGIGRKRARPRSEEHTSELQSRQYLVCRLLLEKKKNTSTTRSSILA